MGIRNIYLPLMLIVAVTAIAFSALPDGTPGLFPQSASNDKSIFYHLEARYQYGEEAVAFDIIVGCAVRVTSYGDGGSSYDAFRDPVVYAKSLGDGSALMQIVPSACLGETTDNGRVPSDFLPGAVWFERADDLSLGIAYVTEDAFESPRSKLKFLSATIRTATQEEWEAFRPIAARNLIDPRPLYTVVPPPPAEEIKKALGDSKALATLWPGMSCHVISRIHLTSEETRAAVHGYWPKPRPRYWRPTQQQFDALLNEFNLFGDADGDPSTNYLSMGHHTAIGFPTRDRGGVIGSAHKEWDLRPPTLFPLRKDEGLPWITSSVLTAPTLFRDVEISDENRGFAYCYRSLVVEKLRSAAPSPLNFITRINGEAIYGEDSDARQPRSFFERDEYLYYSDYFGLN